MVNCLLNRLKYLLSGLTLLGGLSLSAQTEALATFDSGYVETGNPFVLHLSIPGQYGQPEGVDWSPWDSLLPAQNQLRQSGWSLQKDRWVNDISYITFDSAQLELPPLRIRLAGSGELVTNSLQLRVLPTPSPDELAGIRDIKQIEPEPPNWRDYLGFLWPIALGVLLLALAIWWFLYRPRKKGLLGERRIQHPPHVLARLKLKELEQQRYWQQGQVKTYYSELTHICREYLERRYQIPALESPTEDILRQLVHTELPAALLNPLAELLRWADMAKFAKGAPPEYFHQQALDSVYRLVAETEMPEQQPELEQTNTN